MPLELSQLKKLDDYRFLVPRGTKPGMLTDALIFTDERLLKDLLKDLSLEQAINVAMLPGIVGRSLAMPDIHQGYGFPIGGVAATDPHRDGVVSPGGVGFDINCGVRLLGSSLTRGDVLPKLRELVNQMFRDIPSGAGQSGNIRISYPELDTLLVEGAAWMAEHGYGRGEDLTHCEESGTIEGADPGMVSDHAKKRGLPQVGTLGSGNHFLEVQYVERVFDPGPAEALGLYENEVVVLIHSGSRGLGHQVCTDYLREMGPAMHRYGIDLPDRQLACVPVKSPEGKLILPPCAPRQIMPGPIARGLRTLPAWHSSGSSASRRNCASFTTCATTSPSSNATRWKAASAK
jgi:tRNA-splicing ligase RtcB